MIVMKNDKVKTQKKIKDKNTKSNKKVAKNASKNAKTNKTKTVLIEKIEKEYFFGHKEGEDIWNSFLTNKMIAHRGLWDKEAPENSMSAFKKAIEAGYAIELDINPIDDGTPVVFHDSKMSRMTGKDRYIQNISREEFDQTTLLDSGEKIPTFEEVLKLVKGKVPLLIEIKNQQKVGDLEKRVLELLKNYKGEYAIQSFNPYTLKWFYEHAPKIWRGQLSSFFKGEKLGFIKKFALRRLALKKVTHQDFVSYDIQNLPNRWTKKLEIPLVAWTIKKQDDYIKALKYSDNVIFEGFEPKI